MGERRKQAMCFVLLSASLLYSHKACSTERRWNSEQEYLGRFLSKGVAQAFL